MPILLEVRHNATRQNATRHYATDKMQQRQYATRHYATETKCNTNLIGQFY